MGMVTKLRVVESSTSLEELSAGGRGSPCAAPDERDRVKRAKLSQPLRKHLERHFPLIGAMGISYSTVRPFYCTNRATVTE